MAVLGKKACTKTNAGSSKPARTSRAMMRPLLHFEKDQYLSPTRHRFKLTEYFEPPHCSAKIKQAQPGTISAVP